MGNNRPARPWGWACQVPEMEAELLEDEVSPSECGGAFAGAVSSRVVAGVGVPGRWLALGSTTEGPKQCGLGADGTGSEMSTTDVSGDTAGTESDSDDRCAHDSADAEAAAVDAVVAAVAVADSIHQLENVVDSFLADTGPLSADAAHRIDSALNERANDVYFVKLQQSLYAGPVEADLVEALRSFGPGDW